MRRLELLLGVIAIAVFAGNMNYSAYAAGNSKQEITDLEHKCIAATNTDQAMACFDQKEIVLYDFVPPLQYSGATAVRGDLDNFFNNAKDAKGEFVQMDVVTDGKLGIVNSIQHFTWTGKDGKPMEATLRVTDSLHKVGGQWKIFHSHVSAPVDPTTGKAEMNLKS
ncbi:MAG TPA: nuclear transport factor 2 family protein [Candidatus Binataceae bacterium]|nr:nuclear transport factor 2 family protein [Candidatus Binataceae bacterium]